MSAVHAQPHKSSWVPSLLVGLVFVVVVVLLLLWLGGTFHPKIGDAAPGIASVSRDVPPDAVLASVKRIQTPQVETAVGAIRAVHETAIASKLLAKVIQVNVTAGQKVKTDEVLVQLDGADLTARLAQARAAMESAAAANDQAAIEFERTERLFKEGQASKLEFDRARSADRAAQAEHDRATQGVREAETMLAYTTIRAPMDGVIIEKNVEVGDTARPGEVVATLYDPTRMQLVAQVRESIASRLKVGQMLNLEVEALNKTCQGQVSEIVPEAETASRTFAVKVTGPCPDGVYSGMFGRLFIPTGEREMLVIPEAAVRQVGQIELVDVVQNTADGPVVQRRAVQLGQRINGEVQVLSGLRVGEQVIVSPTDET